MPLYIIIILAWISTNVLIVGLYNGWHKKVVAFVKARKSAFMNICVQAWIGVDRQWTQNERVDLPIIDEGKREEIELDEYERSLS